MLCAISPQYGNAAALRSNVQKHLVHFFHKSQLEKLFFLFPDPQFKARVAPSRRPELFGGRIKLRWPGRGASPLPTDWLCLRSPQVSNHRRRIIQRSLLAEYAYLLKEGGVLYTLTDVAELGSWMADRLAACPLFQRLTPEEEAADPCMPLLMASEEAQKAREGDSQDAAPLCCGRASAGIWGSHSVSVAPQVTRNNGKTHLAVFRRICAPTELRHPGH